MADEPTAALDTERDTKVMALLRKIARERRAAVITVTHEHRMIEGFDTVYHMDDGPLTQVERNEQGSSAATLPPETQTTLKLAISLCSDSAWRRRV